MKLSYRDKVIFICAIVVIILIAGFFLFIKPKYQETAQAKSQLQSTQTEEQRIKDKIDTLPTIVSQLKDVAKEIEKTQDVFLTEQDPYLNEQMIYEILKNKKVEVTAMDTSYVLASNFNEYMVYPEHVVAYDMKMKADIYEELPQEVRDAYNEVPLYSGENIVLGITTMTINYKDDYDLETLFDFVDEIAKDERTMTILTVSSEDSLANTGVEKAEGTITMNMYSINPLNVEKVMEESDQVEIVPVQAEQAEQAEQ